MKKFYLLIVYPILLSSAFAQAELSSIYPTSASKCLTGATIIESNDPAIAFLNPASLAMFVDDQVIVNFNHRSQVDFLGFTRFFAPQWGLGINLLPHSDVMRDKSTAILGLGYRVNKDLSVGGSCSLVKVDSGATKSSFSFGLFFRPSPRYRFEKESAPSFLQKEFFRSLTNRVSAAIIFYNLPFSGRGKYHQLRLGVTWKPFRYDFSLSVAWHLRNGGTDLFWGSSLHIFKQINLLLGLENFDLNNAKVGLTSRVHDARLDVSYDFKDQSINFSLGLFFVADKKTQAQLYRTLGTKLVKENDIFGGLRAYKKALAYEPDDETVNLVVSALEEKVSEKKKTIDSLMAMGEKFEKNDINQAESMFSKILEVNANHPGASRYMAKIDSIKSYTFSEYYYRGLGYYNQGRYDRAVKEFSKALALDPSDEETRRYKKLAERKLAENKRKINTLLAEARRFEKKNQFLPAYNRYRRVLSLDENNQIAHQKVNYLRRYISNVVESKYQKGRQLYNKQKWQAAIKAFSDVLAIDPNHRGAKSYLRKSKKELAKMLDDRYSKAKDYFDQKKYEKALEECNRILSINPNHEKAQLLQSRAYSRISIQKLHAKGDKAFAQGDYLTARKIYQEILSQLPDDKLAKNRLAQCQSRLKDRVEQLFNEGMVSYSEGDYSSALQIWNKILAIDPNDNRTKEYIKKATERLEALNRIKKKIE